MHFALIGEELFSIYFYDLFKLKASPLVANILVSIIFGLIHYWTYFNGSILLTILQVIALQGSARFWFNRSYEQSNSILTSFAVHYLFDLAGFMLSFLLH
jgi:membrane protease YdiL (CAAX protease family)